MVPVTALGKNPKIHTAIGAAVEAYSGVEDAQTRILETLLNIKYTQALILFHSVPNIRTKNEMLQGLLKQSHGDKFKNFWVKCSSFLSKLALYRNAVVHWHPQLNIYIGKNGIGTKIANALGNPVPGKKNKSLEIDDFPPFMEDCLYIKRELLQLVVDIKNVAAGSPLPQKYPQPIIRQNLAALQLPPKPKVAQPLRPPSVPKLSRAQKRAKATKDAREKAKSS